MNSNLQRSALSILDELRDISALHQLSGFTEEFDRLHSRLTDEEFRFAVVGEFSAGKSTFINALLGCDLLQHASNETTAAITRIVNVPKKELRVGTGRVVFRNGTEKNIPDLRSLKEYTTTFSTELQVAEEVKLVEIYYPVVGDERNVVLVDTPGLNGMASGHREQTIQLIQKAHACIYLMQRRGIAESDVEFLKYLAKYQKHFIFIQNFIDDFHRIEGETVEGKLAEQLEILRTEVFQDISDAVFDLCGISALQELASQDESITKLYSDSTLPLTSADREQLAISSNFSSFREILEREYNPDALNRMQHGDTIIALCNWLGALAQHITTLHEQANEVYQYSREGRADQRVERSKEKILDRVDRQKVYLRNFVDSSVREITQNERIDIEKDLQKARDKRFAEVENISSLDEMQKAEKKLPQQVTLHVRSLQDECLDRSELQLARVHQILMTRIEEYSGIRADDIGSFEMTLKEENNTVSAKEMKLRDESARLKEAIRKTNEDQRTLKRQQQSLVDNIDKAKLKAEDAKRKVNKADQDYKQKLSNLGSRPQARKERRVEEAYEDRNGFFGKIVQFFVGQKKVEHEITFMNDEAGRAWDQRRADIQRQHVDKGNKLIGELHAAERRREELECNHDANKQRIRINETRIRQKEEALKQLNKLIEMERRVATEEYLRQCKNSMKNQIENYFFSSDGVQHQLEDWIQNMLAEAGQKLTEQAVTRFDEAVKRRLENMQEMQTKEPSELRDKVRDLDEAKGKVVEARDKMEVLIA